MTKLTTLITGASAGIGLELARLAAQDGHDLVLVARRERELAALADELHAAHGVQSTVMAMDLARPGAAGELVQALEAHGLEPDVLVNNAGFGGFQRFVEMSTERISGMIQLNIVTLTELMREFVPRMVGRGSGRVLNVASVASFQPGPGAAVYHATKAFVLSLSEATAHELRGTGVTVTALCPGMTSTGFFGAAGVEANDAMLRFAADPAKVAKTGWRATMRGARVAVPGAANKLSVTLSRVAPHALVLPATESILARAHD